MKQIKASLLLPLLTILFSLTLDGCYTQLAFVNDDQDSAHELSQIVIYQTEIVPIYLPVHEYNPQPSPMFNSLPTAGSSSTGTNSQTSSQIRDSGYQRPDQASSAQSVNSASNNRTSGSTRSGR